MTRTVAPLGSGFSENIGQGTMWANGWVENDIEAPKEVLWSGLRRDALLDAFGLRCVVGKQAIEKCRGHIPLLKVRIVENASV